jgi:L-malate glycosyltransferase
MKIIHAVESYLPLHVGMQEVVTQISERMVAQGHEVIVLTRKVPERQSLNINGVKIVEFDIQGSFVHGLEGEVEKYVEYLLNEQYDVLTLFAAQQWATDIALPLLPLITAKKIFVPTGFSGLKDPAYSAYFAQMPRYMSYFNANVFNTEAYQDYVFGKENQAPNMVLIPNGADERQFSDTNPGDIRQRLGISDSEFVIMHIGTHTGLKGHDEAIQMFAQAEIENAVFVLNANGTQGGCVSKCGQQVGEFNENTKYQQQKKRIISTSLNQEDKVALLKASDLFLFPSNIESSPIVVFEAMAAGLPFLASDVGNLAEMIQWSHGGELIPTARANGNIKFADVPAGARLITELWRDRDLRTRLGDSARAAWQERFTWGKIAQQFLDLYSQPFQKQFVPISETERQPVATDYNFSRRDWLPRTVRLVPLDGDADLVFHTSGKLPDYYYYLALHQISFTPVDAIYPNFSTLAANRPVNNSDLFTLPLHFQGNLDQSELITKYRITDVDVLLNKKVAQTFQHGMVAGLPNLKLGYVPVYRSQPQFDTMQLDEVVKLLEHLSKYSTEILIKRRADLRTFLVSMVNRYKPSRTIISLINQTLTPEQRKAIFARTFGSIKLDCLLIDTKHWLVENWRFLRAFLSLNFRYLRRVVGIILKY